MGGELRFALSEERLSRRKRASGFPHLALVEGLKRCGLAPGDVDLVAVPGVHGRLPLRLLDELYRRSDPHRDPLSPASSAARRLEDVFARAPGLRLAEAAASHAAIGRRLQRLGIRAEIRFVDHHDAHAATARLGGLEDPLVVTLDGYGDGLCGSFGGPGKGREVLRGPRWSPALVYGAVTRVLGFEEGDEGKTMGLAASGDPERYAELFERLIGNGHCEPRLKSPGVRRTLRNARREDVAAALQARLEQVVLGWIEVRRRGHRDIAVSGGLFANVLLNGRLNERFDRIYVFPNMGDGGLCVGAAARVCGDFEVTVPYLGHAYGDAEIESALKRSGVAYERPADAELALAEAIMDGHLCARFFGASEFGPRALGHRSILLRADRPELTARLGRLLERDEFMPFAPVRRYGEGSKTMTVAVNADEVLRERCAAGVHVDGTARTQLADQGADPGFWRLLTRCEAARLPALINTSFNRHGEPIVETPEHALQTFAAARLEVMQLGPFLVRRAG